MQWNINNKINESSPYLCSHNGICWNEFSVIERLEKELWTYSWKVLNVGKVRLVIHTSFGYCQVSCGSSVVNHMCFRQCSNYFICYTHKKMSQLLHAIWLSDVETNIYKFAELNQHTSINHTWIPFAMISLYKINFKTSWSVFILSPLLEERTRITTVHS